MADAPEVRSTPIKYFAKPAQERPGNSYKKGRERVIGLLLALGTALLMAYESGAISFSWQNVHWRPAVLSYALVFFGPFAIFHYLRAQWEMHRAEEEKSRDALSRLTTAESEVSNKATALSTLHSHVETHGQITETVWSIKESARAVKRRWPNSDFEQRPLLKASWMPNGAVNAGEYPWLPFAIRWHESVYACESVAHSLAALHSLYLNSLDFEEVMELLDREERRQKGLSTTPMPSLIMGAQRYDPINGEDEKRYELGLFVRADTGIAYNVNLPAVRIGKHSLRSVAQVAIMPQGQQMFLATHLTDSQGGSVTGDCLRDILQNACRQNQNGYIVPIPLRLIFHDTLGTEYVARHELSFDADRVLVNFLNCEHMVTPQPGGTVSP